VTYRNRTGVAGKVDSDGSESGVITATLRNHNQGLWRKLREIEYTVERDRRELSCIVYLISSYAERLEGS
jgi:hypothetical protein